MPMGSLNNDRLSWSVAPRLRSSLSSKKSEATRPLVMLPKCCPNEVPSSESRSRNSEKLLPIRENSESGRRESNPRSQLGNGRIAIFEDLGLCLENVKTRWNYWGNHLPSFASRVPLNTPKNKTMSPFCRQNSNSSH